MGAHRLIQLRPNRADGAEGASGVLKNVAQLRAIQLAEFLGWQTKQIPAPVADLPLCNAALAAKQPHGSLDQCAFAAAALPHNAQDLPRFQRKAHILHHRLPQIGKLHTVIFEYGFHLLTSGF